MGREERGVNGGIKKLVEKRRVLRNCFREEIGLPMADTGHRENGQSKVQKEWRTGEGESDSGMISKVTKRCFEKR